MRLVSLPSAGVSIVYGLGSAAASVVYDLLKTGIPEWGRAIFVALFTTVWVTVSLAWHSRSEEEG